MSKSRYSLGCFSFIESRMCSSKGAISSFHVLVDFLLRTRNLQALRHLSVCLVLYISLLWLTLCPLNRFQADCKLSNKTTLIMLPIFVAAVCLDPRGILLNVLTVLEGDPG